MIFKRRIPLPLPRRLRNAMWPEMGWRRMIRYLKLRTIRLPGTTHSIAAGLAAGCAISWTPTWGTHCFQAPALAFALRGNLLASFIGTAFCNPWTLPFLIWTSYEAGKAILLFLGQPADGMVLPALIGGYACGAAAFPLFYAVFYRAVAAARAVRRKKITGGA